MKLRIAFGLLLLIVPAAYIVESFLLRHVEPHQQKAEEILLGQIWAVVAPVCAVLGLILLAWRPLMSRLRGARHE
jgi:hypothetical protein